LPEKRDMEGVLLNWVSAGPASVPSNRNASVPWVSRPKILAGPPRNWARISLVSMPFSENSRSPCIWLSKGISGMNVKLLSANRMRPWTCVSSVFSKGTFSLRPTRQSPVPRASSRAPSSSSPKGEFAASAR
jgi:hypothetical protein